MKIYLDNAATTPIDPEVIKVMQEVMIEDYGNASSIHQWGRKARALIETSRKKIAELLAVSPGEIIFTSGGTEADNTALYRSVFDLGVKHVISSPLEHHAVLHTLNDLAKQTQTQIHWIKHNSQGIIDLEHLEELLKKHQNTLVSLMHINNEIGTILPLDQVYALCQEHGALFHSDTVQAMGQYTFPASKPHFMACSAHKFHGPKGVGFLYVQSGLDIKPFMQGGAQERGMRGGTENTYGIVGLAKALEIAYSMREQNQALIQGLQEYLISGLENIFPDIQYNGNPRSGSYKIVNASLPSSPKAEMMLFNLDIAGIAVSAGSACTSGTNIGSHVLQALGSDMSRPSFRFSLSKYNTPEEIDYTLNVLKELYF